MIKIMTKNNRYQYKKYSWLMLGIFIIMANNIKAAAEEELENSIPAQIINDFNGNYISAIACNSNGELASAQGQLCVKIWKKDDIDNFICKQIINTPVDEGPILYLTFDPDLDDKLICKTETVITLWEKNAQEDYERINTLQTTTSVRRFLSSPIACGPHNIFVIASQQGFIELWEKNANQQYMSTILADPNDNTPINSVTFSSEGLLVSGHVNYTIKLWIRNLDGLYTHHQTLMDHTGAINTVTFGPNELLASGSSDGTIKLWEKDASGRYTCIQTLSHRPVINTIPNFNFNRITSLAFGPNGLLAASASNGAITLWQSDEDSNNYKYIQTFQDHRKFINIVAFCPDNMLASTSDDCTIKIWKSERIQPQFKFKFVD